MSECLNGNPSCLQQLHESAPDLFCSLDTFELHDARQLSERHSELASLGSRSPAVACKVCLNVSADPLHRFSVPSLIGLPLLESPPYQIAGTGAVLRVWERAGCVLHAIGEASPGLTGPISWQPNGRHIYAASQDPDGTQVVALFEKNGLSHGSFWTSTGGSTLQGGGNQLEL